MNGRDRTLSKQIDKYFCGCEPYLTTHLRRDLKQKLAADDLDELMKSLAQKKVH